MQQIVAAVQLARESLTDSNPGIGLGQEMVERTHSIDVCFRNTCRSRYTRSRPLAQPSLMLQMLEYISNPVDRGVLFLASAVMVTALFASSSAATSEPDHQLDEERCRAVIAAVSDLIEQKYVNPEVGSKAIAVLRGNLD
ncbi:MAG: hypothetical protein P8Y44_05935 [Acidobacteriota bacterium]